VPHTCNRRLPLERLLVWLTKIAKPARRLARGVDHL
jgi:hypothetical protein